MHPIIFLTFYGFFIFFYDKIRLLSLLFVQLKSILKYSLSFGPFLYTIAAILSCLVCGHACLVLLKKKGHPIGHYLSN